jgi:hypothetical protein
MYWTHISGGNSAGLELATMTTQIVAAMGMSDIKKLYSSIMCQPSRVE